MRGAPVSSPHGSFLASRTEILNPGLVREMESVSQNDVQIAELLTLATPSPRISTG
jgi:hypothetical protein